MKLKNQLLCMFRGQGAFGSDEIAVPDSVGVYPGVGGIAAGSGCHSEGKLLNFLLCRNPVDLTKAVSGKKDGNN